MIFRFEHTHRVDPYALSLLRGFMSAVNDALTQIGAQLTDLKTAVDGLGPAIDSAVQRVIATDAANATNATDNAAAVEQVIALGAQVTALSEGIKAIGDKLAAIDPPAPTPTPEPAPQG